MPLLPEPDPNDGQAMLTQLGDTSQPPLPLVSPEEIRRLQAMLAAQAKATEEARRQPKALLDITVPPPPPSQPKFDPAAIQRVRNQAQDLRRIAPSGAEAGPQRPAPPEPEYKSVVPKSNQLIQRLRTIHDQQQDPSASGGEMGVGAGLTGLLSSLWDNPTEPMAALKEGGIRAMEAPMQAEPSSFTQELNSRGAGLGVIGSAAVEMLNPTSWLGGEVDDVMRAGLAIGGLKKVGKQGAEELAASSKTRQFLESLLPKLDKYGKKRGNLKPDAVLAALQGHPEATPALIQAAEGLVERGKKMSPAETVDTLLGVKHDRGRVLRQGVSRITKEKVAGAPRWVTSPKKENEALEGYLKQMEEGLPGRDFYKDSGESVLFHAGDDADLAHKVGRGISTTSPSTMVSGNTGFAVKGHNQAIAGAPVKTGLYPNVMGKKVGEVYSGNVDDLGPKREPFARQIAMGGGYANEGETTNRAVHDIWEGEAWGYTNPDGTPLRRGFSAAEHQWMDKMQDRAIEEANRRKLGGFDDWNAGNSQAATWTGSRIRGGKVKPGEASKSYADYIKRYYLQGGRESTPGSSTAHLPELATAPQAVRDEYHRRVGEIFYDPQGRDISAKQKGLLTGPGFDNPGIFKGDISPGHQTQTVMGTGVEPQLLKEGPMQMVDPEAKVIDPASLALARANEAEYGLLTGQAATAGSMLDYEAKAALRNAFDLKQKSGTLKATDPILQHPALSGAIKNDVVAAMGTPEGARVLNTNMEGADFNQLMKDLAKSTGEKPAPGRNMGFYDTNQWGAPEGKVGQEYARIIRDQIDLPRGKELFNLSAPDKARLMNALDTEMRDVHGMSLSDTLMQVRAAIAEKGFDGVNEVAKKLGVPLAVLLLLLRSSEEEQVTPSS